MDQTRLTYLLEQYGKNEATPSEKNELQRFLDNGDNASLFLEVVVNLIGTHGAEDFDRSPYAGLSRYILNIDKRATTTSSKGTWRNMLRYWAAAAFVIVLGAGVYWYFQSSGHPDAVVAHTSGSISAPVSNLAIITFANGTRISLDKMENGTIAETGNIKMIKTADGKLSYQSTGNTVVPGTQYHTIENPRGSKAVRIRLLDGSSVWLNVGSSISYPVPFAKAERKVKLDGEAYFDVRKTPSSPFLVQTSTLEVKVLGTAFNVRAYGNENSSQTTLLRGSVEVMLKNKKHNKILLAPYEKMIVQNNILPARRSMAHVEGKDIVYELHNISVNKGDSTVAETEWIQNRLVFKQDKIQNIILVLERWFNVSIEVRRKMPEARLFSGNFENDPLKDILESLKTIIGFDYTIEKKKVIIF